MLNIMQDPPQEVYVCASTEGKDFGTFKLLIWT